MKKLICVCFSIVLLFPLASLAYELDGTATDNGDETYSVTLQNQYGHEYSGDASKNDDGSLSVSVQDYNEESYSGEAEENEDGTYTLDLSNDSTGGDASGTLTIEQDSSN